MPGPSLSGQTTTLRSSQFDQCLGVFDAPLAGAVGVGGGEHAESSRRVDVLLALDDQQGCCRVRGEDAGDRCQIEQQRHPVRPAGRPLFCGLVPAPRSGSASSPIFVTYLVFVQA